MAFGWLDGIAQLGSLALTPFIMADQKRAQDEANAANMRRYNSGLFGLNTSQSDLGPNEAAAYYGRNPDGTTNWNSGELGGGLMGLRQRNMADLAGKWAGTERLAGENFNAMLGDLQRNNALDLQQYGNLFSRSMGDYGAMSNKLMGAYDQALSPVLQGMRDRYTRNMGTLEGMGTQQRKDLNQQYNNLQSQTNQQMLNMGLGNSTVAASMQAGNERQRADAFGRLEEGLRRERIGYDTALSGDLLNTQSGIAGNRMNLLSGLEQGGFNLGQGYAQNLFGLKQGARQSEAALRADYGNQRLGMLQGRADQQIAMDTDSMNRIMNWIYNREDAAPDNSYLGVLQGMGSVTPQIQMRDYYKKQVDQASDPWNRFMGGVTGGMAGGIGGSLALPFAMPLYGASGAMGNAVFNGVSGLGWR
jgi:hypothetical protein